ncbi:hypothetical protein BDZ94DRAFT_1270316 [Collybia nuda]|uniref:Uncharacterized protein n=1 Tax=Collybia nuda TaxID=64659 RepID=A0A9P5XXG0_9AGAR|nr:hypothetical protein BDZ94DRAFT_1270316 [Collybia nuda]
MLFSRTYLYFWIAIPRIMINLLVTQAQGAYDLSRTDRHSMKLVLSGGVAMQLFLLTFWT